MKCLLLVALTVASASAFAADVGVSVSIGQPGFYGRIDIGDFPSPQVIYKQPIAIERVPADRPPIYLRVPQGHAKHWRKYCHEYNACGERVFFVSDDWYNRKYVPHYQKQHGDRRNDRRDERRDDHRGNQNDHYRDQ